MGANCNYTSALDAVVWAGVSAVLGASGAGAFGGLVGMVIGVYTCGLCPFAVIWMAPLGFLFGVWYGLAVGIVATAAGAVSGSSGSLVGRFRLVGAVLGAVVGGLVGYYASDSVGLAVDFINVLNAREGALKIVPGMARPWFMPTGLAAGVTAGIVAGLNPMFLHQFGALLGVGKGKEPISNPPRLT